MKDQKLQKQKLDAARYRKLQGWMSSSSVDHRRMVEAMGALCTWLGREDMDEYLDALPECHSMMQS